MAKEHELSTSGIWNHGELPFWREVRAGKSTAQMRCFYPVEHCGRTWSRQFQRTRALSVYFFWFIQWVRNTAHTIENFGFIDEVTYQELSRLNDEISRMLSSLIYTLKHKTEKRTWCLEDKLLLINLQRHEQKRYKSWVYKLMTSKVSNKTHELICLWTHQLKIKLMNL